MKRLNFTILFLFIFSVYINAQEQFENPGFEDWEAIADFEEPVNWSTIKTCIPENISFVAPVPISKETENVHSGNAAVHIITKKVMSTIANGLLTNGRVFASINIHEGYTFIDPNDGQWNTIVTHRPDSIVGWFRCNPQVGDDGVKDYGMIKIILSSDSTAIPATDSSSWVGFTAYKFPDEPVTEWTRFSIPMEYYNNDTPKYLLSVLTSSRGFDAAEGSELWLDDLELIYNDNNSISEISDNDFNIYSINNQLFVYIKSPKREKLHLNIVNMQGKILTDDVVYTNQKQNLRINANEGIYVAVFTSDNGEKFSKKIFLKHN